MLRTLAGSLLFSSVVALSACSSHGPDANSNASAEEVGGTGPTITEYFDTPSSGGEQPVIDAIGTANTSIRMIMFHLTNPAVVTALVDAATTRHVDVQIILDNGNLASHTPTSITKPLADAGIKVIPSSTGFRITHVKSLVIDSDKALIMSLNLTMDFASTRDYAVMTTDPGVIKEFLSVFDADVTNAANGTDTTPALSSPYLAWSPVNSESRLTDFVKSAKKTLVATSENLGDPDIQKAMIAAAKSGVKVRVISPLCDQNVNPLYDLPYLADLVAGGVDARAMPAPASAQTPYMHAKMMIADGTSAFIGSVNFSTASTTDARELGIFFTDASAIQMISNDFENDWAVSVTPPSSSASVCPSSPGDVAGDDGGAPPPRDDAGAPPPSDDAGSPPQDDGGAGTDGSADCSGYASPSTSASCTGCSSSDDCQANGCYGGYWCDPSSNCVDPSTVPCGQ